MYDTVSGIDDVGGYRRNDNPQIVRYAQSVKLSVELALDEEGKIHKPILEITYWEQTRNLIEHTTTEPCTFLVDYYQTVTFSGYFWTILLSIVVIVMLCCFGIRLNSFTTRNPSSRIDNQTYKKLLAHTILYESTNIFSKYTIYTVFSISMVWFLFYKWADNVSYMLPSLYTNEGQIVYSGLRWLFFATLVTKTLAIILKILEQSRADIFIMDWENLATNKSLGRRDNEQEPDFIDVYGEDSGAVAWRSIFVANEFNELQTEMRKIPPATTLIWFTAFYIGMGWQWIAKWNPGVEDATENPLEPFNPILKFFMSTWLFATIAAIQYFLTFAKSFPVSPPSLQFTDLCILANCSVLILTEQFGGYYIHGEAPWEKSDLPLAWLKAELDKEAQGALGRSRGYAGNDYDKNRPQAPPGTFEIFIYPKLRRDYDAIWSSQITKSQAEIKKNNERLKQ